MSIESVQHLQRLTPHITVESCAEAIEFYKKVFKAEELSKMPTEDGKKIMHATLKFGDSVLMLHDEFPDWGKLGPKSIGKTSLTLHLNVEDVDRDFQIAVDGGAKPIMAPEDMFWGDRYAVVEDPYGHQWSMGKSLKEMTVSEISEAMRKDPNC